MMGLSDVRKSFPIGLAVLIQYRSVTASHPATQPPSQPRRCSYYAQRSGVEPKNQENTYTYALHSTRLHCTELTIIITLIQSAIFNSGPRFRLVICPDSFGTAVRRITLQASGDSSSGVASRPTTSKGAHSRNANGNDNEYSVRLSSACGRPSLTSLGDVTAHRGVKWSSLVAC